jgi:hypothetical protein
METKHASLFHYQADWRADVPELNLSHFVRQRLTPLVPDEQVPDSYDDSGAKQPHHPILGYGGGAGYCDYETSRVHLTLEPWQKQWIEQTATFSFSVFVQGQLDRHLPRDNLPEKRRESLQELGLLTPAEESTDSHTVDTPNTDD